MDVGNLKVGFGFYECVLKIYSQFSRCSTARGPLQVLLRLRLLSLFYSLKVPLKLKKKILLSHFLFLNIVSASKWVFQKNLQHCTNFQSHFCFLFKCWNYFWNFPLFGYFACAINFNEKSCLWVCSASLAPLRIMPNQTGSNHLVLLQCNLFFIFMKKSWWRHPGIILLIHRLSHIHNN